MIEMRISRRWTKQRTEMHVLLSSVSYITFRLDIQSERTRPVVHNAWRQLDIARADLLADSLSFSSLLAQPVVLPSATRDVSSYV